MRRSLYVAAPLVFLASDTGVGYGGGGIAPHSLTLG